uniref:SMODS and SLOG-associating 2TM effector domain-containing protein n=1 Tax=viral metagenome TaxID=1070528 RepID=A0A6C0JW99_9ZZZZ
MAKEEKPEEEKTDAGSNTTNTKSLEWTTENEDIMIEWCDVAQCYKWLNTRAHQKYSYRHAWFTIPAIVLSTVTGTASFAQTSLPTDYQQYAPMVIGTINICIGILTTVQQYLKISELNESHRVAAIAWDKFARNIKIELAKSPLERMECGQFLKHNRQEYDRLMETSPSVPLDILGEFKKTLPGKLGSDQRKKYDTLKKPDICDTIISARDTLYDRSKDILKMPMEYSESNMCNIDELAQKERELYIYKQAEEIRKNELAEKQREQQKIEIQSSLSKLAIEAARKVQYEYKKMDDYVATFLAMYGRKPLSDEIESNFKDEIPDDLLKKYLDKYVLNDGDDNNV